MNVTKEQMLEFLDYIVGRSDKWALGDTVPTTIGEMVAKGPSKFAPPPMTKPDGQTMWNAIRSLIESSGEKESVPSVEAFPSLVSGNDKPSQVLCDDPAPSPESSQSTPVCRAKDDIPCGKEVEEAMGKFQKLIDGYEIDCGVGWMGTEREALAVIRAALTKP
jgi:hypothetical protein